MERQERTKTLTDPGREIRLAAESIARESFEQKDAQIRALAELLKKRNEHIRALQEEIHALRSVVSRIELDPRFWIGFPIGLFDVPWESDKSERRRKPRS